jgi:hypothetical protein
MCNCTAHIFEQCFKICTDCGNSVPILNIDSYNVNSAPLDVSYSRPYRFRLKVERLLGLNHPPKSDPVWEYLNAHKIYINDPFDVREFLKMSKLKCKHYDCVRIFCDVFTNFKCEKFNIHSFLDQAKKSFEELYHNWMAGGDDKFFSYDWLIRQYCETVRSPLIVYLKPETSKKRHLLYSAKMKRVIQFPRNCGRLGRAKLIGRFLSG